MRGAERGDGGEPVEAADAVVGVHHEVADGEAGRLGDEVGGPARLAARAHQPVAEDVLLADDGEIGRLEALLHAEHRKAHLAGGQRLGLGEALDLARVGEAVLGEQRGKPLAGAGREGCNDHALASRLQALHMGDRRRRRHWCLRSRARRRTCAPAAAAVGLHRAPGVALLLEGREVAHGVLRQQRCLHSRVGEEHRVRRHRLVGRRAEALRLEALDARLIVVADQGQALAHGLVGQMIEADGRLGHIVEQRLQTLVEQRQPMLHAGIALPGADRLHRAGPRRMTGPNVST